MKFQLIKDGMGTYSGATGEPHEDFFKGNPTASMCREMIQNSLDARDNVDEPVKVEIRKISVDPQNVPGINEYIEVLEKGLEGQNKDEFENRLALLNEESLPCLVISDYNTVGLAGALEKFNPNNTTPFMALTRGVGDSVQKSGSAGGSFGYGKGAASLNSELKLVFYQTINIDGEIASTGVTSYPTIFLGENHTSTRAFFESSEVGLAEKGLLDFHDSLSKRLKQGTDVVITGFSPANKKWEKDAIKAVLDSFFYSIYTNKLIVEVEGTLIDSNTLEKLVNQYCKNQKTHCYLDSLDKGNRRNHNVQISGKKLGNVNLFLHHSKENKLGIAWVRETGMKIFDLHKDLSLKTFNGKISGVLYIQGEELNKVLKSAEDPTHTRLENKRSEIKKIENYEESYHQIVTFIKESIRDFKMGSEIDSVFISGLGSTLSQDIEGENSDSNREILSNKVTSIKVGNSNSRKKTFKKIEKVVRIKEKGETGHKGKSKNRDSDSGSNHSSVIDRSNELSSRTICRSVENGRYLLIVNNTGGSTKAIISLSLANETAEAGLPLRIIGVTGESDSALQWVTGSHEFVAYLLSNSKTKFELQLDYDELCSIHTEVQVNGTKQ